MAGTLAPLATASNNGQANPAKDKMGNMLVAIQERAKAHGLSIEELAAEYCGCGVPGPGSNPWAAAAQATRYVPWEPAPGSCPQDATRLLCWMYKGLCSFNKFGAVGSVNLRTNTIALPDPDFDFNIGPNGDAVALGVFFPRDWVSEACFHGIFRIKANFQVTVTAGALTAEAIQRSLFDDLDFRILQVGTEDNFHTALNIGEANDAERSTDSPALGGYFLPAGGEFVPFALAPEVFSYDFRGVGPGQVGVDAYNVTAVIRTYFKQVC